MKTEKFVRYPKSRHNKTHTVGDILVPLQHKSGRHCPRNSLNNSCDCCRAVATNDTT